MHVARRVVLSCVYTPCVHYIVVLIGNRVPGNVRSPLVPQKCKKKKLKNKRK